MTKPVRITGFVLIASIFVFMLLWHHFGEAFAYFWVLVAWYIDCLQQSIIDERRLDLYRADFEARWASYLEGVRMPMSAGR
jgi:hypothetical protein